MKRLILFVALIFFGIILNAQIDNCIHSNTNWKSDKNAIETIEKESFAYTDMINGEEESWMLSAHYYSCNKEFGFVIVKGNRKCFIHQNVPVNVWEALKSADSKGGYYNFYIKNKYKLQKNGDEPLL